MGEHAAAEGFNCAVVEALVLKKRGLRPRIKNLCNGAAHFMHAQILVFTWRVYND